MKRSIVLFSFTLCLGSAVCAQQLQMPVSVSANSGSMVSRAPDMQPWKDPAMQHNRLIQQQSPDGVYKMIGNYKVIGNAYLYGQHLKGDLYASEAKAYNIYISYNTFNQDVEFYSSSNPDQPLIKEVGTVDSFTIQEDIAAGLTRSLHFIYGPLIGAKDKVYYQVLCAGERFTVYKRFKSELDYVSTNLGQSDLRQFDLQTEYYYTDNQNKGIKKIKLNKSAVIKEFKSIADLSAIVTDEDFTVNPEETLCKAMGVVNQAKKGF